MRLFDLLYGMRMGGNQPPQQLQAPSMSTPTPAYGFQAPGMSTPTPPQQFQPPGMSQPLPPNQFQPPSMSGPTPPMQGFTPPRMSSPTPPQQMGQQGFAPQGFGRARGLQTAPGLQGRFGSPQHSQAGWMGARAPWSFEP